MNLLMRDNVSVFVVLFFFYVETLTDNNGFNMDCYDDKMIFYLSIDQVDQNDVIKLRNESCAVTRNQTHVVAITGYTECGTVFEETKEFLVFQNTLVITSPNKLKNQMIIRYKDMTRKYKLQCSFMKKHTTIVNRLIHYSESDDPCRTGTNKCDNGTSKCFSNPDAKTYECQCYQGYEKHGFSACVDYCAAQLNTCDRTTTKCVPTPGKGPHFRCDCDREYAVKQGYSKCTTPLQVQRRKTDDDAKIIIIVVVVIAILIIIIISIFVYKKQNQTQRFEISA